MRDAIDIDNDISKELNKIDGLIEQVKVAKQAIYARSYAPPLVELELRGLNHLLSDLECPINDLEEAKDRLGTLTMELWEAYYEQEDPSPGFDPEHDMYRVGQ